MRRVLSSSGLIAALTLSAFAPACSEPVPISVGSGTGMAPGGNFAGGGFANGGTINLNPGGTDSFGGQTSFDSCSGQSPHFAPSRWPISHLDGSLDLVFGPGTRLGATHRDYGFERYVSAPFVSTLLQVARERVAATAADAATLEVCEVDDETDANCVQTWLRDYGLQLYSRPLADEQVEAYLLAYQSARAETDAVQAAENVLVSMVLSPYFVLRIELGTGDGSGQLSQYEVASRISQLAARRAPDRELLKSAAAGELASAEVGALHLRRLWNTAEGRTARDLPFLEWLGVDGESPRADLAPELRADMDAQLRGFVSNVFDNENGALSALLTGSRFPLNARLAEHYGVAVTAGDELEMRDLEPTLFAGLLSSGAFLSRVPSPTLRGARIVDGLRCAELGNPLEAHSQPLAPAATPREQLAVSLQGRPECQGCHQNFDPVGLALSAFDEDGRLSGWDSSGSFTPTRTASPVAVANPQALAHAILGSPDVRECIARRYLELVLDREVASSTLAYVAAPRPRSAERQWLDCFLQTLGSGNPSLITFAESLARSGLMRVRDDAPHNLLAFDPSWDPLEHAYQEALQLDDAYPNPEDAAIVAGYARALDEVRMRQELIPPAGGAGGAGGQDAGGAGGAL